MLGLDYDTFINSAFLRQGNSNEFSRKTAKDRKEILGSILGLNQFEKLRKLAVEETKKSMGEKEGLSRLQEHLQKEIDEVDAVKNSITEIEKELKEINSVTEKLSKEKEVLIYQNQHRQQW